MTGQVRSVRSPEVISVTPGDSACTQRPVQNSVNRTAAEVTARLLRVAEDLARVAADVVVTLHTPAAVVVQAASAAATEPATTRTAWTVAEFADSLGLNPETVRELLRSGDLRGFKVNREWRISEDARLEYIAKQERQVAEELGLAS